MWFYAWFDFQSIPVGDEILKFASVIKVSSKQKLEVLGDGEGALSLFETVFTQCVRNRRIVRIKLLSRV